MTLHRRLTHALGDLFRGAWGRSATGISARAAPPRLDLRRAVAGASIAQAGSGKTLQLFDLFWGVRSTLLTFSDRPLPGLPAMPGLLRVYTITRPGFASATESDALIDRDGDAHRAYGVTKDALALVRPDGYVGLTAGSLAVQPILDYLQEVTGGALVTAPAEQGKIQAEEVAGGAVRSMWAHVRPLRRRNQDDSHPGFYPRQAQHRAVACGERWRKSGRVLYGRIRRSRTVSTPRRRWESRGRAPGHW